MCCHVMVHALTSTVSVMGGVLVLMVHTTKVRPGTTCRFAGFDGAEAVTVLRKPDINDGEAHLAEGDPLDSDRVLQMINMAESARGYDR